MNCCSYHVSGGSPALACGDRNHQYTIGHVVPVGTSVPVSGGVQGPFPGPDWQAECGAAREEAARLRRVVDLLERDLERERAEGAEQLVQEMNTRDRLRAEVEQLRAGGVQMAADHVEACGERDRLRARVEQLKAAMDSSPRVDCVCPGCPRKVPQAWASAMCEPCAAEDCEHTDGARAVAAERDELQRLIDLQHTRTEEADDLWREAHPGNENAIPDLGALVGWLMAERRRFQLNGAEAVGERDGQILRLEREVEQLRAQVGAAVAEVNKQLVKVTAFDDVRRVVHAIDAREHAARERERARILRDLEAAVVNRDQREVSASAQPAGAAAAPTGQAGGAQSGSAGPPAGLGPAVCRKCGRFAAWIRMNLPGGWRWVQECLLGQGCNAGPDVAEAPPGLQVTIRRADDPLWQVGVDPAAPGADRTVDTAGIDVGAEGKRPRRQPAGLTCADVGCLCGKAVPVERAPEGGSRVAHVTEVPPLREWLPPPAPTLSRVKLQQERDELLATLVDLLAEADSNVEDDASRWTAAEAARELVRRIKSAEATT